MLSASLLKKNLAYIKFGSIAKLEYRFDFVTAFLLFPLLSYGIEAVFWMGIFQTSGQQLLGGYSLPQYLTYLLWLMTSLGGPNWRFERGMITDINSGAVNALLVRPTSFYEFHLGQLLGLKLLTLLSSIPIMIAVAYWWQLPIIWSHLPPALCLGICYLMMMYTLNFALACLAFEYDYIWSINITKNMIVWFLAGELFPLDLLPSPLREWVLWVPFSSGVYIPAGYISGRVSTEMFLHGFATVAVGFVLFGILARVLWTRGLRRYSGTGA